MRRYILPILLLCFFGSARGQTAYSYWFDNDRSTLQMGTSANAAFSVEADVSQLTDGLHMLHVQAGSGGELSSPRSYYFLKVPQTEDIAQLTLMAFVDGELYKKEANGTSGGRSLWQLDMTDLPLGLHRLQVVGVTPSGAATSSVSGFFWKTPLGGNGITQYWYWLNDNEQQARRVELAERTTPLQVLELLPVEQVALRSQNFEFRVEQGQPVAYARNEFHMRYFDASGRFSDLSRQYVDEREKLVVSEAPELVRNETTKVSTPAENTIAWYTLPAEPGDSLRLQLSRGAIMQLFSPTGQELLSVQGVEAVQGSGIHAEEQGNYYLALHDATTSDATLALTYEHIDKYAVLRQDVTAVGNGGSSTITFQGNGFDALQSVELVQGSTVIRSAAVSAQDKATASIKFDFTDAPLGQYEAVFHFADGDITALQPITVEEAVATTYDATAAYAPQYLQSQASTYVFSVENQGNMTAYDVPMTLHICTADAESLTDVSTTGIDLGSYTDTDASDHVEGFPYERTYTLSATLAPRLISQLAFSIKSTQVVYVYLAIAHIVNVGGRSEPVSSLDPNDIYGYQNEDGTRALRNGQTQVWYTIEFENDPEFATAPAHEIRVTDVLSPSLFDLSSFAPTRIKIGEEEVMLTDADRANKVVTMLMRSLGVGIVAEVSWTVDEATGTVSWLVRSLDAQTGNPTTYVSDGVLPVNTDGRGIGELSFDIAIKPNLPNGTEIPNKATIVFDENAPIDTPVWTNVIESNLVAGDVNGDGTVSPSDAVMILYHFFNIEQTDFNAKAADVNGDGTVTPADAIETLYMYFGAGSNAVRQKKKSINRSNSN